MICWLSKLSLCCFFRLQSRCSPCNLLLLCDLQGNTAWKFCLEFGSMDFPQIWFCNACFPTTYVCYPTTYVCYNFIQLYKFRFRTCFNGLRPLLKGLPRVCKYSFFWSEIKAPSWCLSAFHTLGIGWSLRSLM